MYAAESAAIKGLPQGLLRQCLLSGLQFGVKDVEVCDGIGIFERGNVPALIPVVYKCVKIVVALRQLVTGCKADGEETALCGCFIHKTVEKLGIIGACGDV